jgi:phage-related protein
MLNETFYLDGVDARSAGIQLQAPIEFSEAVPVVEAQTIPGRNGDLIWETGSYENRSGEASCFCLQKDVEKAISATGRYLMAKKGYRRLETSDDPDHYWMARVENSPQIAMRLRTLAPFEIGFDCKPQRFLKSGENAIIFQEDGSLFNQYGQIALPLITLYGKGAGLLTIGNCIVEVKELDGVLYLDSETQNAYNDSGNQNLNINAPTFPILADGEINIAFTGGIERVEIIPRWWEL